MPCVKQFRMLNYLQAFILGKFGSSFSVGSFENEIRLNHCEKNESEFPSDQNTIHPIATIISEYPNRINYIFGYLKRKLMCLQAFRHLQTVINWPQAICLVFYNFVSIKKALFKLLSLIRLLKC